MKIDFNQKLLDLEGNPIKHGETSVTLAELACLVLQAADPEKDKEPADEKIHRAVLAQDIYRAKKAGQAVDLVSEDIVLLKRLINAAYNPLAVMRAFEILEPKGRG